MSNRDTERIEHTVQATEEKENASDSEGAGGGGGGGGGSSLAMASGSSSAAPSHRDLILDIFEKHDPDRLGTISINRLQEIIAFLQPEAHTADIEPIWHRMDPENSGNINYYNFIDLLFPPEAESAGQLEEKTPGEDLPASSSDNLFTGGEDSWKLLKQASQRQHGDGREAGKGKLQSPFVARLRSKVQQQQQQRSSAYTQLEELLAVAQRDEVRLVNGRFLVEWFEQHRGPIMRRQDMPMQAFLDPQSLHADRVHIVAMSYAWCTSEHPDPDQFHLEKMVSVMRLLLDGDPDHADEDDRSKGFISGITADTQLGVFWDYMSLPQQPRSDSDDSLFKAALKNINAWYGNRDVATWIMPDLPEASLLTRTGYDSSGWTRFETEVSNIISPPGRMLRWEGGGSWRRQTNYLNACRFGSSEACKRTGPLKPEDSEAVLGTLRFTNGADADAVVKPKYREAFSILIRDTAGLSFAHYKMPASACRKALQTVQTQCCSLRHLDLSSAIGSVDAPPFTVGEIAALVGPRWGEAAAAEAGERPDLLTLKLRLWGREHLIGDLSDLIAPLGKSLKTLDLHDCSGLTGDVEGLATLSLLESLYLSGCRLLTGDVRTFTALTQLETLFLASCSSLTGSVQSFAHLRHLETLHLAGCSRLTGNVQSFASLSRSLRTLNLSSCSLLTGDIGSFAALSHLETLYLAGCSQLTGDAQSFASLSQLQGLHTLSLYGCTGMTGTVRSLAPLASRLLFLNLDGCTRIKGDRAALRLSAQATFLW